jgi:hypothetical protein
MINEGRELKTTTITESNRGNAEVMDSRVFPPVLKKAILTKNIGYFIRKGKDVKVFFVIGRASSAL